MFHSWSVEGQGEKNDAAHYVFLLPVRFLTNDVHTVFVVPTLFEALVGTVPRMSATFCLLFSVSPYGTIIVDDSCRLPLVCLVQRFLGFSTSRDIAKPFLLLSWNKVAPGSRQHWRPFFATHSPYVRFSRGERHFSFFGVSGHSVSFYFLLAKVVLENLWEARAPNKFV